MLKFNCKQWFLEEIEDGLPWVPVLLSLGIIIYLSTDNGIPLGLLFIISSALCFLLYFLRKNYKYFYILLSVTLITLGYTAISIRTYTVKTPTIKEELTNTTVWGEIADIRRQGKAQTILLAVTDISGLPKHPKYLRIKNYHIYKYLQKGYKIKLTATLMPLPLPSVPNGFDFAGYFYFKEIGGIGYTLKRPKIIKRKDNGNYIDNLRDNIRKRINDVMGTKIGGLAAAMLIGRSYMIDRPTYEKWQVSGIAHLIAISGIHMVIVVGFLFITFRHILCLFPPLQSILNIKKISALIALAGGIFYLLISGAPISAQRAFTMSALVLCSILLDRKITPIRSISLAAIITMLTQPESIANPSMQMSYAACFGLIATFHIFRNKFLSNWRNHNSLCIRISLYFNSIIIATIIATIATTPFVLYHFHRLSNYSMIANLISIPIHEFLVMPSGIIALVLMPFNLAIIPLKIMEYSLILINESATYIDSLPAAYVSVPYFPPSTLFLLTYGGLICIISRTPLRYLGAVMIILSILIGFGTSTPDISLAGDGKLIMLHETGSRKIILGKSRSRLLKQTWQERYYTDDIIKGYKATGRNFHCDGNYCVFEKSGKTARIIINPNYLTGQCELCPELFINLTDTDFTCANAEINITLNDLRANGVYEIRISNDNIKTTSTKKSLMIKPWND